METCGNQECRGATPDLRASLKNIISTIYNCIIWFIPLTIDKIRLIMIIIDPRVWTRKYLIVVSVKEGVSLNKRMGIKLIKLTSNPNHANSHEEDEIEISEPIIRVGITQIICGLIKIKKEKIYTFINRVWTY